MKKMEKKMVMSMNIMITVLGMKARPKKVRDMERASSFTKKVVSMMDNGKTGRSMELEHFTMLVETLLTMDNGKMKCLMEEE